MMKAKTWWAISVAMGLIFAAIAFRNELDDGNKIWTGMWIFDSALFFHAALTWYQTIKLERRR